MTERIKERITLPAIIAVIGLVVTLGTLTVNVSAKSAKTVEKVDKIEQEINTCKDKIDNKIGSEQYYKDIQNINTTLIRIEQKLDGHISTQ